MRRLQRLRERGHRFYLEFLLDAAELDGRDDVPQQISRLQASGVSLSAIALALAPFVVELVAGRQIDWQAVFQALLALRPQATAPQP